MPVTTLPCGCTLDTDLVDEEHRPSGNPYHKAKGAPQALPEPASVAPEDWPTEDEPPKKKR